MELDLALAGEEGFSVGPVTEARRLAAFDVLRVRADNPGPLTLSGTNTWIVDRDPAYVIDPGPALRATHRAGAGGGGRARGAGGDRAHP